MVLEDRPVLRGFLRIALVLFLLALAITADDLVSRLGIRHPNLAGTTILVVLAVIFVFGWIFNSQTN